MSRELMSYGELMSGGTNVLDSSFIQILVATSRQKVTAIVETFVSVRQIIIICLVWALSILEYILFINYLPPLDNVQIFWSRFGLPFPSEDWTEQKEKR